jgi:hypothetical protein
MFALAACGAAAAQELEQPASADDFAVPISNQVETHQEDQTHEHSHLTPAELTGEVQVVLVPTELVVGPNRFSVGLFGAEGEMIHEADVHFHYYDLSDPEQAVLETETDAYRVQDPAELTTIFAHERDFARAGDWGLEVELHMPDGNAARSRIGFRVEADTASFTPGEKVPSLKTRTLDDVDQDLSLVTSARDPNPTLYELSLAEAIANSKPTMLLFATPEFCQTRFCGPAYRTFNNLQKQFGDRVNFIHIEVFAGLPNPAHYGFKLAPPVEAFGLQSDPWVYFIDEQGTVIYRIEGLFTEAEIEQWLQAHFGFQEGD